MSKAGHYIARRLYPATHCGAYGAVAAERRLERHHKDGNHLNNAPENVVVLCTKCHMTADGRLDLVTQRSRSMQKLGAAARRKWSGLACAVSGCRLPAKYKGLCNAHYYRARNNGGDPGTSPVRAYRRAQ